MASPGRVCLEAEIVTADGEVRVANACSNLDLFWALKGGGGGFGVVTRVTLKTHELPDDFGVVLAAIKANSDDAYGRLAAKILAFYRDALFNPHWGEQIAFLPGRALSITMVFQGLDRGAGGSGLASVLRLGLGHAAGFRHRVAAEGPRRPGATFLGPCRAQEDSGIGHVGRPPGRACRQHLLGQQSR